MASSNGSPRGLCAFYFQIILSMCLWLLSACLGVVGPHPQYVLIVSGGAAPATVPTTTFAPAPFPTFAPLPSTAPPATPAPTTAAPTTTTTTTARPLTFPPLTPVPTSPPITAPPGTIPTQQTMPVIDPRLATPPTMPQTESLTRFGGVEYADVVIEANGEGEITFPRDKRSLKDEVEVFGDYDQSENHSSIFRTKRQTTCGCVTASTCPGGNTDGSGLIDFRIVAGQANGQETCVSPQRYCCGIGITPLPQTSCGARLLTSSTYPTQAGQSRYGDFPWMIVILTTDNQYVGGGTLIDTQHVITTAHRISQYPNGSGIKIRAGEWDAAGNYEQYPYRDFTISRVWIHESFKSNSLQNDLAVIRLTTVIPPGTPAVVPVCLPTAGQTFDGRRCWVSGWGKDAFGVGGRYQTILKTVDVPIIPSATCEASLRTSRLGQSFILDRTSFLCAGGEALKDACTGDGGSGLVCELTTGKWTVVGLVAWGLGCATSGVPGVYVNVVNYLPWINARVASR